MTYLTLDCNKLLSIDDLCLVGLSKVHISIEPELAKKINLNLEELNSVEKCNNSTDFEVPFVDIEYLKSRMICCNVLQQALRWKPKPNSLFITKLVKALNTNSYFNRFPAETTLYNGDYTYTQSPGIPRMLSTVTSPKSDLKNPSEVLQKEVGLSSDELNSLVNSQTEFLSNVSVLGSLMKTMSNLSDLNMGLLCEALSVPYDFLLLPELQKIPNVMETVRNLLWLTEDSKLIPKKGGDKTVKSLVSTQLVHNAELRSLAQSILKEVSKVFSSICSNLVQPELQNVVNKAWSASLDSQLNALLYSLKNVTVLYNELLPLMFSKYSESYNNVRIIQLNIFYIILI
ncbi:uncharacterized protein TA19085 [Theileria annulata]|uniref:Uncharacterized protein n=1 Tax=Theileria annulata TaxID=5874 RepID=Q4UG96_THEAN|nr:uncharacterized protein TA19085 [Theileria annulata]CAI73893.1 hypothetical protein TA19085 [Theileria annulata]|eukprot:XP_954570.1 hypothetical protein TA19085 [Theileria annulata]